MEELNIKGEKVRKQDGEIYSVIDFDFNNNSDFVKLDDGKNGYKLKIVFEKQTFSFIDENVQRKLKQFINSIIIEPSKEEKESSKIPHIDEAVKLFKNEGIGRNVSEDFSFSWSFLQSGKTYGKVALDIYLKCCNKLDFKVSKSSFFAKQQILFASNATEFGYAVWMLPNSSYTGKTSGVWANVIDGDRIYEFWKEDATGDSSDRITFAKQKDGEYVFLGVYTLESCERINVEIEQEDIHIYYLKIYKRESKTYPQKD